MTTTTPFDYLNQEAASPLLLICDHASNKVPPHLGTLGLEEEYFEQHIAYDIGAAAVTKGLSQRLDMSCVLAGYSRLAIDLNRPLGHPESIPEVSDRVIVPGNAKLTETEKQDRARPLFEPYHDAINEALAHIWNRGTPPALFSIHSFTPHYGEEIRPWDVGVLWNRDPRIAVPLIDRLKQTGMNVGDNLPYSGRDQLAFTIDMHGTAAGIANCAIEIRQDHVADEAGIEKWTNILETALSEIILLEGVFKVQHF